MIDSMMAKTMQAAGDKLPKRWTVKYPTRARTAPLKMGWDLGVVPEGFEFTSSWIMFGWISITARKWVLASSVEEIPQVEIPPIMLVPDPSWKYAIVKHNPNRPEAYKVNKFTPDTITLQDVPQGDRKGKTIPIYPAWWKFIRTINNEMGYRYARSISAMWINQKYNQDADNPNPPPKAEAVMGGGNVIAIDAETKTHLRLVAQSYLTDTTQLDWRVDNWYNAPYLYWYANAINKDGKLMRVGSGWDVFFPLIKFTELWIRKEKVERFPDGYNYRFYGANVYDGDKPLMTVGRSGVQMFHTPWRIETQGILPPSGWV